MSKSSFQEKLLERFCGKRPSSWKTIRLAEFFSERVERREPDASCPLYSFTIESGVTPKTDRYERSFLVKEDGEDSFKTVHPGDFVMNPMNLRWGAIGQSKTKAPVTVSGYYDVLIPKFNKGAGLLESLLRSYQILSLYDIVATGSLLEKKRVHCSQFLDLCIYWPPEPEVEKLCDILTTWDEALTQLDALIEAQERRKKALMQQLLTGRRRLKGFTDKWKASRFGEFLVESRIPGNDGSNANKLTVKLYGRGVVPKQERLAGSENTGYYQRKAGQFIYSKLDFLNGAFGIIPGSLDGYETTLDVPAFDVRPTADPQWLLHFVCREEFYSQQLGAAAGGRKARRVNPSEFLAMKILAPSIEEQRQIAAILDTADQQLTLLRTQRTALDQQKRGLMQRLLTGRLRVQA